MQLQEFKIEPINLPQDKQQIALWKQKYQKTSEFKAIVEYILDGDENVPLDAIIEIHHEKAPIGYDEKKLALVAKTNDGEVIAFFITDVFDLSTTSPNVFLQYVVINPKFQNQGYGTAIFTEMFANAKKYFTVKPTLYFTFIENTNNASIKLFKKFNFNFANTNEPKFFKAEANAERILTPQFE